jgi:hypothetical protein
MGFSCSEQDQGRKEGGQTTLSWNGPAVFDCEQLYADAYSDVSGWHQRKKKKERWYTIRLFVLKEGAMGHAA